MIVFSIFGKIFKKKEQEEVEKEEEVEKKEEKHLVPRDLTIEKEEKEIIKSELKPGPLTEKFFELTSIKEKKKEEKE